MGCAGSKLDDLQPVALCRDRSLCLAEAIHLRHALADAHEAYLRSLRGVGDNLRHFFDGSGQLSPPSPVLPLPPQRKGDPMPPLSPSPPPPAPVRYHSPSDSASHLPFNPSDSEYSDEDDGPLHSGHSSPLHHRLHHQLLEDYAATAGGLTTSINFATKNPAPPAVSYVQRPPSPEVVQVGESSFYGYPYTASHDSYSGYGGTPAGGFFGGYPPSPAKAGASSPTGHPPPPPSPPKASAWDFLNPFETLETDYPPYTPSRSSKELRDEEGIPDLEEEVNEAVQEASGDKSSEAAASSSGIEEEDEQHSGKPSAAPPEDKNAKRTADEQPQPQARPEVAEEEPSAIVHQKVVPESRPVSEAAQDLQLFFDRASDSGGEVSKMLEIGKCFYHRKKYEVISSKMRNAVVLPLSLEHPSPTGESTSLEFDEEMAMESGNLSSTLRKLAIWEKKLYEEVKAEEKLRVLYEQKRRRLRRMEERGAEARRVGPTELLVRKLSTKIKVAIQVVDSIASRISSLRDEELWPQLLELIHGMVAMWKTMVECHGNQYRAVVESRSFDGGKMNEDRTEAARHLELALLKWIDAFCSWFHAQRSFVKALNGWLLKCLAYEPEVTVDGVAPFSPGRIGAPPVFVVCNQWALAMDTVSDGEVVAAMQAFAASVLRLWDCGRLADRQRMMANRDMDRRLRAHEREELVVQRAVDALNRKLHVASESDGALVYGRMVLRPPASAHDGGGGSLREELKRIFDAMERLAESSLRIYLDLCARNEEEKGLEERETARGREREVDGSVSPAMYVH